MSNCRLYHLLVIHDCTSQFLLLLLLSSRCACPPRLSLMTPRHNVHLIVPFS